MKLIWEDGSFLEKPFGSKVVGLQRDRKRPAKLELDWSDVAKFLDMTDDALKLRYIRHLLLSLAYKKEINELSRTDS